MMTHLGVIFSCLVSSFRRFFSFRRRRFVVCRRWIISHFIQLCGMDDE